MGTVGMRADGYACRKLGSAGVRNRKHDITRAGGDDGGLP